MAGCEQGWKQDPKTGAYLLTHELSGGLSLAWLVFELLDPDLGQKHKVYSANVFTYKKPLASVNIHVSASCPEVVQKVDIIGGQGNIATYYDGCGNQSGVKITQNRNLPVELSYDNCHNFCWFGLETGDRVDQYDNLVAIKTAAITRLKLLILQGGGIIIATSDFWEKRNWEVNPAPIALKSLLALSHLNWGAANRAEAVAATVQELANERIHSWV